MNNFPSILTPRFLKNYYQIHIEISIKELRKDIYRSMLTLNWVYDFDPYFKQYKIKFIPLQERIIDKIRKELKNLHWKLEKKRNNLYKIKPVTLIKYNYSFPYRNTVKPKITEFDYQISKKELESIELTSSFIV